MCSVTRNRSRQRLRKNKTVRGLRKLDIQSVCREYIQLYTEMFHIYIRAMTQNERERDMWSYNRHHKVTS